MNRNRKIARKYFENREKEKITADAAKNLIVTKKASN